MEEKESINNKSSNSEFINKNENKSILKPENINVGCENKRKLKSEIEKMEKDINELAEICCGLKDEIFTSKNKVEEIKSELSKRVEQKNSLQNKLKKIEKDPTGHEATEYIKNEKQMIVRQHLNDLISAKIPELDTNTKNNLSYFESYSNIMWEHLEVTFCDYENKSDSNTSNLNLHFLPGNKMSNTNLQIKPNNLNTLDNNNNNLKNINNLDYETNHHFIDNDNKNQIMDNVNKNINNKNQGKFSNKEEINLNTIIPGVIELQNFAVRKKQAFQKQAFRISSITNFEQLKETACQFFRISNSKNYIITDEAESILINEELCINDYMKNYSVFSNNFKLVSLQYLKMRTQLNKTQKDIIKIGNAKKNEGQNKGLMSNSEGEGSAYDKTVGIIRTFLNDYSGLKQYILKEGEEKSEKSGNANKKKTLFSSSMVTKIDTSFAMMIMLLLFYIFTILFIYSSRDIGRNNLKIKFLQSFFNNTDVTDYKSFYKFIISKIGLIHNDINFSLNETNGPNLDKLLEAFSILGYDDYIIGSNNSKTLPITIDFNKFTNDVNLHKQNKVNFYFASSIHMIVNKVNDKKCTNSEFQNLQNSSNPYCFYEFYSSDTLKKSDLILQQFDNNEYIVEKNLFSDLIKFKTSAEAHIKLEPFDFLATGPIIPGEMEFSPFRGNVYKYSTNIIADFVRIIIITFLSVIMIFEIKQNYSSTDDLYESILCVKNILTLFTILLFIISLFDRLIYLSSKEDKIMESKGMNYVDTYYMSSIYNTVYLIECLLFSAVSLKLLIFLKLNDYIKLFYTTIENGFLAFIKYSLFFLGIILGYTFISYIIWGPYLKDFSTFGSTFIQVLMLTMGFINTESLLIYNTWWTIFFITTFFIFLVLYMYSIFISLYSESFRKNIIENGYPQDHDKTKWILNDYIRWITNITGEAKKKPEEQQNN